MNSFNYESLVDNQGRLIVDRLPRPVYTSYVNEYRKQPAVIREVFRMLYFEFDLDQKLDEAAAGGYELDVTEAADQIIGDMDDGDWWRVMQAFEEHAISHFGDDPERWSSVFEKAAGQ